MQIIILACWIVEDLPSRVLLDKIRMVSLIKYCITIGIPDQCQKSWLEIELIKSMNEEKHVS